MPTASDLVTDLPADFETFGQAVATSMADLLGGTTGQILSKASNTDMDFTWITNDVGDITAVTAGTGLSGGGSSGAVSLAIDSTVATLTGTQTLTNKTLTSPALTTPTISTLTTNGDLLYGTGSGAIERRAIGTTGQVLTVSGGVPVWSSPAGGGKVLQVVQDTLVTGFSTSSSSPTDTGLTVSITPSSTSSKIMIFASAPQAYSSAIGSNKTTNYSEFNLVRGSTQLCATVIGTYSYASSSNQDFYVPVSMSYLDSPATTSATTYKVQAKIIDSTGVGITGSATVISSIVVMEIGA